MGDGVTESARALLRLRFSRRFLSSLARFLCLAAARCLARFMCQLWASDTTDVLYQQCSRESWRDWAELLSYATAISSLAFSAASILCNNCLFSSSSSATVRSRFRPWAAVPSPGVVAVLISGPAGKNHLQAKREYTKEVVGMGANRCHPKFAPAACSIEEEGLLQTRRMYPA